MAFRNKRGFKQIVKDKGFYIALAICLLAVGVVTVVSLVNSLPPVGKQEETPSADRTTGTPSTPSTTATQAVEIPVTGVADLRTTTAVPTTTTTATVPIEPTEDLYVLPLTNEVLTPFSGGQPVFSQTMGDWRTHNGVDFVGKDGQKVKAAAEGTVTVITSDVMWGDVVEIDHGFGIVSRYCGVSARNIAVGDHVKVGDVIGVLGGIPCEAADPPHLHFEIAASGKYLDAVAVIGVEVRYTEK